MKYMYARGMSDNKTIIDWRLAGHHNQFICCVILDSDSNCAL